MSSSTQTVQVPVAILETAASCLQDLANGWPRRELHADPDEVSRELLQYAKGTPPPSGEVSP